MRAKLFAEENKKWWTLTAVSFGLFMIMLDNTVVNVALPSIQRSLHLKVSELEWVVAGYALTFGAFMLTGGKLADLLGRRKMFVVGLVIFTASSLACGLAGSASRADRRPRRSGARRGADEPGDALDHHGHLPAQQRGTAIGIWAGVSALALAIGPLVGGVITEHVNWNWIFFINVPIGVIGIAAAYAFISESRDTSREQRPDIPGLLTSGARTVRAQLRADRGQQLRLGLGPHPGGVRHRRRRARRVRRCSSSASGCRCSTSHCSATRSSAAPTP